MDWVNQHKLRNWLIAVLLAVNILTVSIIWMHTARQQEVPPQQQNARASESVQLLKRALDLSEDQTRRLEQLRKGQLEQSRQYNDRQSVLKRELAEELFSSMPDTALARQKAIEIGALQSNVELIRFEHFNALLALCTPEQKEKLKPIVIEIFGRKPPKEDSKEKEWRGGRKEEEIPRDRNAPEPQRDTPRARRDVAPDRRDDRRPDPRDDGPEGRRDERPQPPSTDEKLAKYSERLNLTGDQLQKIRVVLETLQQKAEELRKKPNPDRDEIETEKKRIRKEEDESIMKILNEDQKREFERMIMKRRK